MRRRSEGSRGVGRDVAWGGGRRRAGAAWGARLGGAGSVGGDVSGEGLPCSVPVSEATEGKTKRVTIFAFYRLQCYIEPSTIVHRRFPQPQWHRA